MTARILDGRAVAREIRAEVRERCERLKREHDLVPGLTVILVGDHPASKVYVRNKEKAAREAGMRSETLRLSASASEAEVAAAVERLNRDERVHGILVQLPLPQEMDAQRILEHIHPDKDVDGFHPVNAGRLLLGLPGFVPCTPAGILELLRRHGIELAGRRAAVIGRSNIVGKPMAVLLLREHCTVTVCHSRTRDLPSVASEAEILVVAAGKPAMVTAAYIRPGAVVVDVGIHPVRDEQTCRRLFGDDPKRLGALRRQGSTLVGDVHPLEARERAGWLSPVPGGVGPLTIAMLLRNAVLAAERAAGLGPW